MPSSKLLILIVESFDVLVVKLIVIVGGFIAL